MIILCWYQISHPKFFSHMSSYYAKQKLWLSLIFAVLIYQKGWRVDKSNPHWTFGKMKISLIKVDGRGICYSMTAWWYHDFLLIISVLLINVIIIVCVYIIPWYLWFFSYIGLLTFMIKFKCTGLEGETQKAYWKCWYWCWK